MEIDGVVQVCKAAFGAIYQISSKKIAVIQKKLQEGQSEPSADQRGRHSNRPHAIRRGDSDKVEEKK